MQDIEFRETVFVLDAKIKYWMESVLPTIPIVPRRDPAPQLQTRQLLLVRTVSCLIFL